MPRFTRCLFCNFFLHLACSSLPASSTWFGRFAAIEFHVRRKELVPNSDRSSSGSSPPSPCSLYLVIRLSTYVFQNPAMLHRLPPVVLKTSPSGSCTGPRPTCASSRSACTTHVPVLSGHSPCV